MFYRPDRVNIKASACQLLCLSLALGTQPVALAAEAQPDGQGSPRRQIASAPVGLGSASTVHPHAPGSTSVAHPHTPSSVGSTSAVSSQAAAAPMHAHRHQRPAKQTENTADVVTNDPLSGLSRWYERDLPVCVQSAADRSCKIARQFGQILAGKSGQVEQWLAHCWKQMNTLPVVTPVGSPYVTPSSRHLRLMPDGRLKTVVGK